MIFYKADKKNNFIINYDSLIKDAILSLNKSQKKDCNN